MVAKVGAGPADDLRPQLDARPRSGICRAQRRNEAPSASLPDAAIARKYDRWTRGWSYNAVRDGLVDAGLVYHRRIG